MRTYSHAILTRAAFRHRGERPATAATLGATLPDLPALIGTAWLAATRPKRLSREGFESDVCGRSLFAHPDAALHAALPVSAALTLYAVSGARGWDPDGILLAFLLGWAGHVVSDALTHGTDARPILWPLSNHRFQSPVSYRERDRHAVPFALAEHAATLAVVRRAFTRA